MDVALVAAASGCASRDIVPPLPPDTRPARIEVLAGSEQTAEVGSLLPTPIRVRVTNTRGEPLSGVTVSFDSASGIGVLEPAQALTGMDGVASTSWRLGLTAGRQRTIARVHAPDLMRAELYAVALAPTPIPLRSAGGSLALAGGRILVEVAEGSGTLPTLRIALEDTSSDVRASGYPDITVQPSLSTIDRSLVLRVQRLPGTGRLSAIAVGRVQPDETVALVPSSVDAATGAVFFSNDDLHEPIAGPATPLLPRPASARDSGERFRIVAVPLERRREWTVSFADPGPSVNVEAGDGSLFPVLSLRDVVREVIAEWNRLLMDPVVSSPLRLLEQGTGDIQIRFAELNRGKGGEVRFCSVRSCARPNGRIILINDALQWAPIALDQRARFAYVLRHEMGHAIGLDHFNSGLCNFGLTRRGIASGIINRATCGIDEHVMAFELGSSPDPPLSCGDVESFRSLYEIATGPSPTCAKHIRFSITTPPGEPLALGSDLRTLAEARVTDSEGRGISGISATILVRSPTNIRSTIRATSDAEGILRVPADRVIASVAGNWRLAVYLGRVEIVAERMVPVGRRTELGLGFGEEQFAAIPAGSFRMGSDERGRADEQPVRDVTLTRGFKLQRSEVTQSQWREVMGNSPSFHSRCGETCPVETVSWNDIQAFLTRLNQRDPGKGYRLPTEAEWEYAARAGSTGDYAGTGILDEMGWWFGNSRGNPQPVGTKRPNAWGLFDMHGNVWEFVQDWYQFDYYAAAPSVDPPGPSLGATRVLRGGSFAGNAGMARASSRSSFILTLGVNFYGFRLARSP